jgi:cell shape-determining protein MreC
MKKAVVHQPFNATQLHLLKMFSFTKTEQTLQDLKKVLREFYIQQVENEVDKYQIDDRVLNEHLRTPYK